MLSMLLLVLQATACGGQAAALMTEARARVDAFDVPAAVAALTRAAGRGCLEADAAAAYLAGLQAAREAYRFGGDPSSLAPVRAAEATLARYADRGNRQAEIARFVLMAASAGAQSERDDMRLLLEQALQLESLQLAVGAPGAPFIPAHEVAGDLWLQVHRFETARTAYRAAASAPGETPRVLIGLARTAVRLGDAPAACAAYTRLAASSGAATSAAPEIAEARERAADPACRRGDPAALR